MALEAGVPMIERWRASSGPIPTVLRIDVEPDENQVTPESRSWAGFVAMADAVDRLRPQVEDRSGFPLHPTWFLRLDPDIEHHFGRADFVLECHGGIIDRLRGAGDPLGIHVHPYRWDERRHVTYSDHSDIAWVTHCLGIAAETFEKRFAEPVRRSCQGGYFLSEAVIDASVDLGIEVDVTPEPGLPPRASDPSFGAYANAPSTDYRHWPRRPYYPSRHDISVPAASAAAARPILVVPLSAYDFETALAPLPRRLRNRLRPWRRGHLPLSPWRSWPSPDVYWDLIARAVAEQPAKYVALAIRTDAPASRTHRGVCALLEGLPGHRIGKRLRFVDPLDPEIRRLATTTGGWSGEDAVACRHATP
jgi:hypothetical protein